MKKTMKYLSMAVVALMGAVMAACSADDSIVSEPQQSQGRAVTLTTTVNMGSGSTTRALTSKGVKTFAVGEQMTFWYNSNTPAEWADDNYRIAVSEPLKASDISADGKSATITVTMIDPMPRSGFDVFYPAPMGGPQFKSVKEANNYWSPLQACMAGQDGTLEYVAANVDSAYEGGKLTDDAKLPSSITLVNDFAIFAVTIKNADGTQDVTSTIKDLTIIYNSSTEITISRKTAGDTIYFATPAWENLNIEYTATTFDGNTTYTKTVTGKTYEEGHFYALGLRMTPVAPASPEGIINGLFSVSDTKQVNFSKGNLQATTSDNGANWTWAFAENQFDFVGGAAANTSISGNGTVSANGTVDLFGWSTSATYYGINSSTESSTYSGDFSDWGSLAITNGGNTANSGWRTLTEDEWVYLFHYRNSGCSVNGEDKPARYTMATINTDGTVVKGIILFPDNVTFASTEASWVSINDASDFATTCTTAQWTALEAKGCVFLPAASMRWGNEYLNFGARGFYWSSMANGDNNAYGPSFISYGNQNNLSTRDNAPRNSGYSVRLVKDAQ